MALRLGLGADCLREAPAVETRLWVVRTVFTVTEHDLKNFFGGGQLHVTDHVATEVLQQMGWELHF